MTREEAIKWVNIRMCMGRGKFTEHHPPIIDEVWEAGLMAIEALSVDLVRCGECIYRDSCSELGEKIEADDYCSFGKRRSDD